MNRSIHIITLSILGYSHMMAQSTVERIEIEDKKQSSTLLKNMNVGITMGTTGIGLDVGLPISKSVEIRAGFDFMPHFDKTMHFNVQVGEDSDPEVQNQKFARLSEMFTEMFGTEIDRNVDMVGTAKMQNAKILVDVYPLRNKHWHITGGFYWGPSTIGSAVNAVEDATSLVSVSMYNSLYERVYYSYTHDEPFINMGGNDLYATETLWNKFKNYGRMGVNLGEFKNIYQTDQNGNIVVDANGNPIHATYMLEPDELNTAKAQLKVKNFKPYLGFGYKGGLSKKDKTYSIAFDCGVMFWGGTPDVLVHNYHLTDKDPNLDKNPEGTMMVPSTVNLTKDLQNVRGKVGTYTRFVKKMKAYPVISLRIAKKIFSK